MNSADGKINELNQSILQLDFSKFKPEEEINFKGEKLLSGSLSFQNDVYKGELLICLNPGKDKLEKEHISLRSIGFKHKKKSHRKFDIIYNTDPKIVIVTDGESSIYKGSDDLDIKYPRALHPDDRLEQNKAHKIVARGVNTLQKLLSYSGTGGNKKDCA